ncbi:MAG: hypothetical protein ACJAVK_001953 [Akkermansiaceae bacterium]|jgi:hypothetical protein
MLMKVFVVAFLAIFTAHGLGLTSPFSSNVVLPMDAQVTLRGRKAPSDTIAVTLNGSTIEGKISSLSSKPQAQVAKKLPNTHLILTRDIGYDSPNVHPPNKKPIADRLAAKILNE